FVRATPLAQHDRMARRLLDRRVEPDLRHPRVQPLRGGAHVAAMLAPGAYARDPEELEELFAKPVQVGIDVVVNLTHPSYSSGKGRLGAGRGGGHGPVYRRRYGQAGPGASAAARTGARVANRSAARAPRANRHDHFESGHGGGAGPLHGSALRHPGAGGRSARASRADPQKSLNPGTLIAGGNAVIRYGPYARRIRTTAAATYHPNRSSFVSHPVLAGICAVSVNGISWRSFRFPKKTVMKRISRKSAAP